MYHLSNLINSNPQLPGWLLGSLIIFVWWLLVWLIVGFLVRRRIRPARVIILSFTVIFLAGAIFIFNLIMAPVILLLLYPLALFCLSACFITAIIYLIKVNDSEYVSRKNFIDTDPFELDKFKKKSALSRKYFS